MSERLTVVAKAIYDNKGEFDNRIYDHYSVNEIAEEIEKLRKKGWISDNWINDVYETFTQGYPVYINLDDAMNWKFLTIRDKSKTREDILSKIREMKGKKV